MVSLTDTEVARPYNQEDAYIHTVYLCMEMETGLCC